MQPLRGPGSSSPTQAPESVSAWGGQGRPGSGPGQHLGRLPSWRELLHRGATLLGALRAHPDMSSSCRCRLDWSPVISEP